MGSLSHRSACAISVCVITTPSWIRLNPPLELALACLDSILVWLIAVKSSKQSKIQKPISWKKPCSRIKSEQQVLKPNPFCKQTADDIFTFSDWEATNEAIEEQVARESYLQWLRDNERRTAGNSKSATVTSADLKATAAAACTEVSSSPSRAKALKDEETKAARSSPKPGCSHSSETTQYSVSPMQNDMI